MRVLSRAVGALIVAAIAVPSIRGQTPTLVLSHVNVVDVERGAIKADVTVIIGKGRIAAVAAAESRPPAGAQTIDAKGKYLFDDSKASHYTVVRPLLKKYGFGATFFITEGFTFRTNKEEYLTWEQIAGLHHGRTHLGRVVRQSRRSVTHVPGATSINHRHRTISRSFSRAAVVIQSDGAGQPSSR